MEAALGLLIPPGLDLATAIGLIVLSVFTSAITAALSLGGGMLLLSVMVIVLPAQVLIPVHGLVQFGSNAGRSVLRRRHVDWHMAVWMALGAVIGALVGGSFVNLLPEPVFALTIGLFVLVTTWIRLPKQVAQGRTTLFGVGAVIGALGMVIGATGPLTALLLSRNPDRRVLVATHAVIMTAQHLSKVVVYVGLGFVIGPWLPLVATMIVAGLFGTWSGSRLLDRLPERAFRIGLKLVLTVISLDLARRGLVGLFPNLSVS